MFISYEQTEKEAQLFLKKYHSDFSAPVPIERIVEIDLQISIVPIKGLLARESIDAFLSHDFTELYIDHDHYMGQTNRSRFTLAHEVGHYVLHRAVVAQITSIEQWRRFILGQGTGRAVYEIHADNFAGCLLMPRDQIRAEYEIQKKTVEDRFRAAGLEIPDKSTLLSFMANEIARKFDVSPKAAEIRLSKISP
ncbi:MAG: ImmA/IrrE family metallo-endopeptidase [Oligoflexia bacterium]|nr:ImmA/IrrE family metallo-endopeptidase [Oligoflexia bacterium]